jgi:hypothetical protein
MIAPYERRKISVKKRASPSHPTLDGKNVSEETYNHPFQKTHVWKSL